MKVGTASPSSPRQDFLNLNPTLNHNLPGVEGIEIMSKITSMRGTRAFSLIEVMIAVAIFFMASFVILALVSSGLRTARMLRTTRPNAGMLAAEMTLTNQLEEGSESGDFGKMYREYTWEKDTAEAGTNGLWQVDFKIYRRGQRSVPDSTMSILIFSPGSKTKRLGVQP